MKKNNNPFFIAEQQALLIGLLSFFGGISQDIFIPILPLYLANVLNLPKSFIGLTEGVVTASSSIFKIIAGIVSDKFKKQKPIIFVGYFLSFLARPLLAFTTGGLGVLFLRFLDGVGKGVKDPAKDVLIAASTEREVRGKSFGIVRALDTLGSVVGPIILFFLLFLLKEEKLKYHYIFFLTAIPLFVTLAIISFFVKENNIKKEKTGNKATKLSGGFYVFLGISLLFSLGNSGSAFLILKAQYAGVSLLTIPLVYALFNFVYASFSIPIGELSDKIGRQKVIIIGWIFFALSYAGFGLWNNIYLVWLGFGLYGIFFATTEGVAKAWVADLTEEGARGTAYGLYNMALGLVSLPSSFIAGFLWDKINPAAPFLFSAILASIASVLLSMMVII